MRSTLLVTLHATLLTGVALPATAYAASGESTPLKLGDGDPTVPSTTGGGGTIVRTIVGLAVVLAVIWGLTWVLRQVRSSREGAAAGKGLTALATLPLAGDRSLHLVRAGDEVVLVGAGAHGVTPVRTWTLEEARRMGLVDDREDDDSGLGGPGPSGFGTVVERLRSRTVIK